MLGDVLMQRIEGRWAAEERSGADSLTISNSLQPTTGAPPPSTSPTPLPAAAAAAAPLNTASLEPEPASSDALRHPPRTDDAIDWPRVARMGVYRMAVFGPIFSVFIRRLEMAVKAPGARGVAIKVAMDQLVLQPPVVCLFYFTMAVFEGRPFRDGVDRAIEMLVPTIKLNAPFWTTVHIVTFSVIPAQHRVLWVSLIQCGWTSVMSHLNHGAASRQTPLPAVETISPNAG
jgi:hypothetical protein